MGASALVCVAAGGTEAGMPSWAPGAGSSRCRGRELGSGSTFTPRASGSQSCCLSSPVQSETSLIQWVLAGTWQSPIGRRCHNRARASSPGWVTRLNQPSGNYLSPPRVRTGVMRGKVVRWRTIRRVTAARGTRRPQAGQLAALVPASARWVVQTGSENWWSCPHWRRVGDP